MKYPPYNTTYPAYQSNERFFSLIGKLTVAAAVIGLAFYAGKFFQAPAQAKATAPVSAEVTATAKAAEATTTATESQALTSYLESYAFNSLGENVGTVHEVITRYGCSGYYKPYCQQATAYGWEAQQ